ncbi:MAG: SDR family oxidoreductase [Deltaproteobacteria bacterium]|nr:SDR family oxidoreductase [Deltaproteobacteria bacterium]
MESLRGKVAIVTGASSPRGMGYAAAIKLARKGADVIVTDVAAAGPRLNEAAAAIEAEGVRSKPVIVDVTDEAQVQACVDQVVETFGGIDILFNNAGVGQLGLFEDTDLAVWDLNYQVNVRGVVAFIKSVVPAMKKRGGGAIVNNASIGGLYADMECSAYNSSKFAVVGLTKALALELGQYNIRVNAVCPGFVDTEMGDRIPTYFAEKEGCTPEEMREAFTQMIALGVYAKPDQVADAVVFLAGEESGYITGVALPVAGGYPQAL